MLAWRSGIDLSGLLIALLNGIHMNSKKLEDLTLKSTIDSVFSSFIHIP